MPVEMSQDLRSGALVYHRHPRPGKLEIVATKPLGNQRDLALAYSPGVAAACEAIVDDPAEAANLTVRQNLVAVLTNGTAVLGLGDIGPLASKPVMEGKAVLFKKFAGIDVFDIEVEQKDVTKLVDLICALEPTFGGINLEDIKSPECFEVEAQCRERMKIPVFHDDQHGTAIIVAAAILNGMELAGKKLDQVKLVTSGAGAAALACLNLLVSLGIKRENIWVTDIDGVVFKGRNVAIDRWKEVYVQDTDKRTLSDVIEGADIFLGLSAAGVLKPELLKKMAEKPLIMALANPNPEIMPELAMEARPDAMICTGRSDYPNQVNNVLCFPYIFRGALDCGATQINEAMKHATVRAIAELAREAPSDVVTRAYGGAVRTFGADMLIPSPFDPRLILRIAPAVAKAAMETGVAKAPIKSFSAYEERLTRFAFRSGFIMRPIFRNAKANPQRVIYAEGEDERALRAALTAIEEGIATPILVGRPKVVEERCERFGLSIRPGRDFELINPEGDPRYKDYIQTYLDIAGRKGITPEAARTHVRTNNTIIAAVAVRRGDADAMICGLEGRFRSRLQIIRDVIGLAPGVSDLAAMTLMITGKGAFFLADTHVNENPSLEQIVNIALKAATEVKRFGIVPKIALVSHSDFGSHDSASARKMRDAANCIAQLAPDLEVDGEMQADSALSDLVRDRVLPTSRLTGQANILIMPTLDAANIANELTKVIGDALPVGPILLGTAFPAHIATSTTTARGVVNMTAIASVQALARKEALLSGKDQS
jgi:malate dehydrogenase (oxaloacetate-decarboxylating)(NADP+)